VLVAGGGVLAALAVRRWSQVQAAMSRVGGKLPPTRLPALLSGAILAVAVLMLVVLVLRPPMP